MYIHIYTYNIINTYTYVHILPCNLYIYIYIINTYTYVHILPYNLSSAVMRISLTLVDTARTGLPLRSASNSFVKQLQN